MRCREAQAGPFEEEEKQIGKDIKWEYIEKDKRTL